MPLENKPANGVSSETSPVFPNPVPKPYVSPLKQIRTFQGDVASALGKQKESLFSIQQAEHAKMAVSQKVPEPVAIEAKEAKNRETILLTFGGAALLTLALTGAFFGYREYTMRTLPPTLSVPESRIIAVQSEKTINFASTTRENLIASIWEMSTGVGEGEIRHLVLRKGSDESSPLATTAEFMEKMESRVPASLVRSFEPVFMMGSLLNSRFIILKLSSFENAFPGMLAWEQNMASDIGSLFATEQALKSIAPASVFKDVISRNKDVRILKGADDQPLLMYSFFDNQMLIITDNLATLQTVVERLTQELLSR